MVAFCEDVHWFTSPVVRQGGEPIPNVISRDLVQAHSAIRAAKSNHQMLFPMSERVTGYDLLGCPKRQILLDSFVHRYSDCAMGSNALARCHPFPTNSEGVCIHPYDLLKLFVASPSHRIEVENSAAMLLPLFSQCLCCQFPLLLIRETLLVLPAFLIAPNQMKRLFGAVCPVFVENAGRWHPRPGDSGGPIWGMSGGHGGRILTYSDLVKPQSLTYERLI